MPMVPAKRKSTYVYQRQTKKAKAPMSFTKKLHNSLQTYYKDYQSGTTMFHDTTHAFNLFGNIGRGVNDDNRTGDEIFAKKLDLGFCIEWSSVNDTSLRIMVIAVDEFVNGGTDNFVVSAFLQENFLRVGGATTFIQIAPVDKRKCEVIYDKLSMYQAKAGTASGKQTSINIEIPLNKKITYKTGTNDGKYKNYYAVIIPYQVGGTKGTTNLGGLAQRSTLEFVDI